MTEVVKVDLGGVVVSRRVWRRHDAPLPTSGEATASGVDVASGSGPEPPPVVLLPGTGMTARDWDDVAHVLSTTRTAHAVDLRGHGSSSRPGRYSTALMAADVVGLLDRVCAGPVDLVGHSLGGLVACRVAAQRPDLVRRLVLEDVGMPHPRRPAAPERPPGELDFDWAVVEQVRPEIDDPDPGWAAVVRGIEAPTLVVGGGAKSTVPQHHVRELADSLRDGRSATVDTGHLVHATAPARFLELVLAFLDG